MRGVALGWLAVGLGILQGGSVPSPVAAQTGPPVIAVVPFEDAGSHGRDDEEFAGLRHAIAAVLGTELGRLNAARVLERGEVVRLLAGEGSATAARLDGGTVARVGRAGGARYVIAGTFIDLYGEVRVDARLIDTEDARVLKVVRSDPKLTDRRQLYRIIRSVAERMVETGTLGPAGADAAPARGLTTEALADFGRGLLYLDRGDTARAQEFLSRASGSSPDFVEAAAALQALRTKG